MVSITLIYYKYLPERSICSIDRTLMGTTPPGQTELRRK